MKKTLLALFGLNLTVSFGQVVTNDFENVSLLVESFDNGSSGSGGFSEDYAFYENVFDDTWGSWSGFSVSNVTDNTTAGWGNQYSAFAGSGAGNSNNYGIYYPVGGIDLTTGANGVYLDSVKITNTTYSAISMRDGDSYGKQFGSLYDAAGNLDGTNGEDYFRIWIMVEYLSGQKDSIEFYLADYRFSDPNDDYIVEEWVNVDLSSFDQPAVRLDFRFESSDMGQWGINTPTYFAIDDLSFTAVAGLQDPKIDVTMYPNPVVDVLNVSANNFNGIIEIYDLFGKVVLSQDFAGTVFLDVAQLKTGAYVLALKDEQGIMFRETFLK